MIEDDAVVTQISTYTTVANRSAWYWTCDV